MKINEILDELEKPENARLIENLAHLKHLEHLDEIGNMRGFKGVVAKIAMAFTQKYIDVIMLMSELKTPADVSAFREEHHAILEKMSNQFNMNLGINSVEDLKNLAELMELEELKELRNA